MGAVSGRQGTAKFVRLTAMGLCLLSLNVAAADWKAKGLTVSLLKRRLPFFSFAKKFCKEHPRKAFKQVECDSQLGVMASQSSGPYGWRRCQH